MKIITVMNLLGSVGKTETVINLARALVLKSKKVLCIDLDSQANATKALGVNNSNNTSIYDFLLKDKKLEECIFHLPNTDIDLIPCSKEIINQERTIANINDFENYLLNLAAKMRRNLININKIYDYILIDCSGCIDSISQIVLIFSDSLLIPCTEYDEERTDDMLRIYSFTKEKYNKNLEIEGILKIQLSDEGYISNTDSKLIKKHKSHVFKTVVPKDTNIPYSSSNGMTAIYYDPDSVGAKAYMQLAEEIINN